jgi:VWFA-related protein
MAVLALTLLLSAFAVVTKGQGPGGQKTGQADETIRIDTELVQTNVAVFDKKGQFVDGLGREQFELRVDGKPVPVSFFERVATGASAAERGAAEKNSAPKATGAPEVRGRTIVFFIDDLHLSLDSLGRTREALRHFLDEEMTPWDQVAVVSASGQIGFLQQFTDNKAVLRAAMSRLKPIPYTVRDIEQPPMPEYVAIRIQAGDRDAADLYIDKILESIVSKKTGKGMNRNGVFEMVKTRAKQIVFALESVAANSLASLESLMRTTQRMPGRKIVFFISDGFYLETRGSISTANTQLQRVTDAATRTGSVIYTIDARGLFALLPDATGDRPFDPKGRLDRAVVGEAMLSQDGLNALAGDTGGRFLKNQNYFDRWVSRVLDETSNYYVLAWRPETEAQKAGQFKHVEVSVTGRPELTVRLQRGYFEGGAPMVAGAKQSGPDEKATAKGKAASAADNDLHPAPTATATKRTTIPTLLSTSFVDVPGSGTVLTSSVQVATDTLNYGEDGKQAGAVDVAGLVINEQGKQVADFKTRLNVTPLAASAASHGARGVIYNHRTPLAPGLYLIKVAARDGRSGQAGSASQWIEIPDLTKRQLTLSSLLLGGVVVNGAGEEKSAQSPQIQFSVDRRFARSARLNFMLFVYNAAQAQGGGGAANGLTVQVQVLSNTGRAIVDTHAKPLTINATEDPTRIPYSGSFPLQALAPGHYLLRINVTDSAAKSSATQQAAFIVE